ncbi:glycosyltransferase [Marinobacter salarius]|uniref:glycosyltransferase n=1 Tax=Marinobacter salarius TaxID=1420917 RepID=UPI0025A49F96|nr:glycosyltransferase [Marinobacter salarius]MDM8179065.1 glycosyltransferase [Marinobacter salarius]
MKKIANVVLNDFTNDTRVWKVSQSLVRAGNVVSVVAVHNEGLKEYDEVSGVNVERLKLATRSWSKIKIVQFIKYLEFLIRSFVRFRKYDLIHCNDLGTLPIGVAIKIFGKDVKVVYDCHEYETEMDSIGRFEKILRKILERGLIKYADSVITVSSSIADEYRRLYSVARPALVLNCPVFYEIENRDVFRKSFGIRPDQKIFLYQGGLKSGRGIEILVDSFSNLANDKNVLIVMGYGPLQGLVEKAAQENDLVFFHSAVNPDVLLDYTCSADYGILFYEDTCLNHRYCSPNKMFEYLMAGLPVLTSDLFEMKRLVETEGVGIVARENTSNGFGQAVVDSLQQDYAAIQRNVFRARKKYCWEEQEKILKAVYENL